MNNTWKSLNTVTTFSKLLALALFVALPFIGFKLGYDYGYYFREAVDIQEELIDEGIILTEGTDNDIEEDILEEEINNLIYTSENFGISFSYPEDEVSILDEVDGGITVSFYNDKNASLLVNYHDENSESWEDEKGLTYTIDGEDITSLYFTIGEGTPIDPDTLQESYETDKELCDYTWSVEKYTFVVKEELDIEISYEENSSSCPKNKGFQGPLESSKQILKGIVESITFID